MSCVMQGKNANDAIISSVKQNAKCYALCSMTLYELLIQWFKEHSQTEFAEKAGVQESTVSRWKNKEVPPTFENCLRIARAMNEDPRKIFEAANKPQFAELFESFLPGYKPPEPTPAAEFSCQDPSHSDWHKLLDAILNSQSDQSGFWITGIKSNLIAMARAASGATSKGEHGPFDVTAPFLPGDNFEFRKSKPKRRRK